MLLKIFEYPAVALRCLDPARKWASAVLRFSLYGVEKGNCINPLST